MQKGLHRALSTTVQLSAWSTNKRHKRFFLEITMFAERNGGGWCCSGGISDFGSKGDDPPTAGERHRTRLHRHRPHSNAPPGTRRRWRRITNTRHLKFWHQRRRPNDLRCRQRKIRRMLHRATSTSMATTLQLSCTRLPRKMLLQRPN